MILASSLSNFREARYIAAQGEAASDKTLLSACATTGSVQKPRHRLLASNSRPNHHKDPLERTEHPGNNRVPIVRRSIPRGQNPTQINPGSAWTVGSRRAVSGRLRNEAPEVTEETRARALRDLHRACKLSGKRGPRKGN